MNVKQIVIDYLKEHGYDGLYSDDCGCGLDDFMPCDSIWVDDCKPAYKVQCLHDYEAECVKRDCYGPLGATCRASEEE